MGVFALLAVICYVAEQNIAFIVFCCSLGYFCWYIVLQKRLVCYCETIVARTQRGDDSRISSVQLGIDIVRPPSWVIHTPILGLIYMLTVSSFCIYGRPKSKKSCVCDVTLIGFVLVNINNIYNLIFGDWDQGVVLFKYTIQGNEYTFMKRSTKRSIFIQIMLFSMNGIYTLFKDKKARTDDLCHGTYLSRDGNRVERSPR